MLQLKDGSSLAAIIALIDDSFLCPAVPVAVVSIPPTVELVAELLLFLFI